ncbi:MAG: enoyl-CoA hydratase/isomerase family protein [Betaproteobacteria bacterium]|nr:enoyl-CoA hydratase/isomerase family protein [Betaproteobacteria bacterium]
MSDNLSEGIQLAGPLLFNVNCGIATVTLHDPRTRNSLSERVIDLIVESVERVNADVDVKCMVITGSGSTFCSGGNMKEMFTQGSFTQGSSVAIRKAMMGYQRIVRAIQSLEVPSIAAINGPAVGGGFDLALACDMRLASENAKLIQRFLSLGVISADGGWWLLPRIVGLARAYEIALQDKPINAENALKLGLVSAVFGVEQFMPKTIEFAQEISRHPPHSIRLAKRLIQQSSRCDLDASLELAASMQADLYRTEDQREAVAAFVEKRSGNYKGR